MEILDIGRLLPLIIGFRFANDNRRATLSVKEQTLDRRFATRDVFISRLPGLKKTGLPSGAVMRRPARDQIL
jgi:hypothetical protein